MQQLSTDTEQFTLPLTEPVQSAPIIKYTCSVTF